MRRFARFELIVAFRFMRDGLMQTLLIVLGVGLGGGVIIFLSAILAGLQSNVVNRTLNFQAPIVILPPDQVARPLRPEPQSGVASQVQPRAQQLRSIDQGQKVRDQVARTPGVGPPCPFEQVHQSVPASTSASGNNHTSRDRPSRASSRPGMIFRCRPREGPTSRCEVPGESHDPGVLLWRSGCSCSAGRAPINGIASPENDRSGGLRET